MKFRPILLGVNVDHIATLRQVRGTTYPVPVEAALLAEKAGADGITAHLREDRRHIQDRDLHLMREVIQTHLNMEMAVTDEMIGIARDIKPDACCLVPEKREELTTEGGLDVAGQFERVKAACESLGESGIEVSLFIDPNDIQIEAAQRAGAPVIELHTGCYAEAKRGNREREWQQIRQAARLGDSLGMQVNAGHGIHYHNVEAIARIPEIVELNIGHAIVARAVLTGLTKAVMEMKRLMREARRDILTIMG